MVVARQATPADWPQMVALDRAIFGGYGAQEEPAIIQARLTVFPEGCVVLEESVDHESTRREAMKQQVESAEMLGYLTTEKWLALREPTLDEDPHQTHHAAGRILNITTLAIAPAHQNRGLGALLIAQVKQIAEREGCTEIVLETAHAEAFYRRHGFQKIGERQERAIQLHIMHICLQKT